LEKDNSDLKTRNRDDKSYLHFLEKQVHQNQKALEDLAKELVVFPLASQNIEATDHESLSNQISSTQETLGQSNQAILADANESNFYRTQSYASFFPKQSSKDNQFISRAAKSNAELCGIQNDVPSFSSALNVFFVP
jgi:predicted ATP-grasp superfamily ATP-dependent carboligase